MTLRAPLYAACEDGAAARNRALAYVAQAGPQGRSRSPNLPPGEVFMSPCGSDDLGVRDSGEASTPLGLALPVATMLGEADRTNGRPHRLTGAGGRVPVHYVDRPPALSPIRL